MYTEKEQKGLAIIFIVFLCLILLFAVQSNDVTDKSIMNSTDYKSINSKQQTEMNIRIEDENIPQWKKEGYNSFKEFKNDRKFKNDTLIDPDTKVLYIKDFWGRITPLYTADGPLKISDK